MQDLAYGVRYVRLEANIAQKTITYYRNMHRLLGAGRERGKIICYNYG